VSLEEGLERTLESLAA